MVKRIGPRILPWLTDEVTFVKHEDFPFKGTCCILLVSLPISNPNKNLSFNSILADLEEEVPVRCFVKTFSIIYVD
jgi:hypothetical protein